MNLSASRLVTFNRCRHAYQLKYQRQVPEAPIRASQLSLALHKALEHFYNWPAYRGFPQLDNLLTCWETVLSHYSLTERQREQGWQYLQQYYQAHVSHLDQWIEPLATEGRMQASLLIGGLRFKLTGRYDRLDFLDGQGLHLIDYKLNASPLPDTLALDIQLGLYALMLEQVYQKALTQVSHHYLSTGHTESFTVTPHQQETVREHILELAQALVQEKSFDPSIGSHCRSCTVRQYCQSHTPGAALLPQKSSRLQLALVLE